MICSHDGAKSQLLGQKLHSKTSKTKAGLGGLVQAVLFWKSHCATCAPACVILCHANRSCKDLLQEMFLNVLLH